MNTHAYTHARAHTHKHTHTHTHKTLTVHKTHSTPASFQQAPFLGPACIPSPRSQHPTPRHQRAHHHSALTIAECLESSLLSLGEFCQALTSSPDASHWALPRAIDVIVHPTRPALLPLHHWRRMGIGHRQVSVVHAVRANCDFRDVILERVTEVGRRIAVRCQSLDGHKGKEHLL